jgi:glycogen debranching enzyme
MSDRLARRIGRTDRIRTSRPAFNDWLDRSSADLALLTSDLSTGPYPYAGIPWFSAPFGRDGIVAALQTLWLDTELAAGVLDFLAATRATTFYAFHDAEPGKILHEHQNGEMCRVGALPFHHYYGGVDRTLLFVVLAGAYRNRSGDLDRIRRLEPAIRAALGWATENTSRSSHGFVQYARSTKSGLRNQGWKDSEHAIFHDDATLAEGPIALVEAQGYHVEALRAAADLLEALGAQDALDALRTQAADLVRKIDASFRDEDLGTFCMALDGHGSKVRVSASNADHLLYCDSVLPERHDALARTLASAELKSGWGLRTVSTASSRFNPMGYHTGTVWPHDTSIVAAGLARSGRSAEACALTDELFNASVHFPEHRFTELWCGLARGETAAPVAYSSACSPQVWAAGTPFLCLQACLGLNLDAAQKRVTVSNPVLPAYIERLDLDEVPLAGGRFGLRFKRSGDDVSVETLRADAGISVDGP